MLTAVFSQVVLEVATPTPPPTAPVKKSYRKIKKVPGPTHIPSEKV